LDQPRLSSPLELSRTYRARGGAPSAARVDERVFTFGYYQDCMGCKFCQDWCCSWGCDVDLGSVSRLETEGDALERHVGSPSRDWFLQECPTAESDAVGGGYLRTAVRDGACVFLNRRGRGCLIHGYALAHGLAVREFKPMCCSLFPLTVDQGLVRPMLLEHDLVCTGPGMTAYRAARDDLAWYFGEDFVTELDGIEEQVSRRP
jgi:Fe-S-cluster containining protein